MYGDAVAAETACHGDVYGCIDGDLGGLILGGVKLNRVCERIAAGKPPRDDIHSIGIYDDIFAFARIDPRRVADGVLCLQPQGMPCRVDVDIAGGGVNAREHVRRLVAEQILAESDDGIAGVGLRGRDGICFCRAALPYGGTVLCGRGSEYDGGRCT